MKIIVRADDLGYADAINYGIRKVVTDGVANNIGVMINKKYAKNGINLISNENICLGLHTNISSGKPVSDPALIPSLIRGNFFKRSAEYNNSSQDIVVVQEAEIETQNQIEKFKSLVGYLPQYIDFHAVFSPNFATAVKNVAQRNGIPFIGLSSKDKPIYVNKKSVITHIAKGQTQQELFDQFKKIVNSDCNGTINLIIYHPGYLDAEVLNRSSLNKKRVYDAAFLASQELKEFSTLNHVEFKKINEL